MLGNESAPRPRHMKRAAGQDRSLTARWRPATQAVRAGTWRSEQGETSEAIYVNSGYTYDNAATAAARFAGEEPGMTYSRGQNPSVQMLEERIAMMEGAEACRAQASGMAAMSGVMLSQLSAGDHLVAARALFGPCRWVIENVLPRFGIETTLVDSTVNEEWDAAIRPETKLFFFETPANPTMEVADIAAISEIAHAKGIPVAVDNAFASPALQKPMEFGADIVAYSATKLMDGQGRVLAGAVCASKDWINEHLLPWQRNTGPTLAPFNAWVVLKGLETLELRAMKQSENALEVARWLEGRGLNVLYPGLESHPQHDLAAKQMRASGTIFSILLEGGREDAWALLDALQLIDISNNIGDTRSLMCHPASTTHYTVGEEGRAAMGVTDGMVRLNVGLEDPQDLIEDLERALDTAGL